MQQPIFKVFLVCRAGADHEGLWSDQFEDAVFEYASSSWSDDLAWGASWIYLATKQGAWLDHAIRWASDPCQAAPWSWDNKRPRVLYLLVNYNERAPDSLKETVTTFCRKSGFCCFLQLSDKKALQIVLEGQQDGSNRQKSKLQLV